MGFIKCPLHVDSSLLSLAASTQLNNAVEDPLRGLSPGRTADLASPNLDETTKNSN